ncbi:MAG TPA: energy transducer TonB [Allosphingosinicella sp.]
MNRRFQAFVLAACAVPAAAARPPEAHRSVKPWVLDYGATACTAFKPYGSDSAPVSLAFRPSANGQVVRLVIARPGRFAPASQFDVAVKVAGEALKTSGLRFGTKEKREIVWINVPNAHLAGLRGTGEITISGGPLNELFSLPKIGAVLDGLEKCNADLRRHWNVGDAAALARTAEPEQPLFHYFTTGDYPMDAFEEGASGVSRVMMMVDETGALADCLVEETSGVASLDAMACFVLQKRAKFRPAIDAAGKPARSVLTQSVTWGMPPPP